MQLALNQVNRHGANGVRSRTPPAIGHVSVDAAEAAGTDYLIPAGARILRGAPHVRLRQSSGVPPCQGVVVWA
jgi:hypothetical protein